MPYFMACVRETLRLSPSVSMLLPRYVSPGGMYIGKTWVPDGTEISASPFVLHRDKQLFGDDAELFNPERWLGDVERVRLMQKYFFAFGYGSRKCIGRHLAMFEAQKFCMQVWKACQYHSILTDSLKQQLFRDFDVQYWSQNQPCRMENWGINVYFEQFVKLEPRAAITATSDGTRS